MKKIFLSVLISFLFFNFSSAQNKQLKPSGAFQWCPFHCETIRFNSDLTFDYYLEGDLFGEQRNQGKWKFISKDKIYLQTNELPLDISVTEKIGNPSNKIKFQAFDPNGAIFSNVEVWVDNIKFLTDENGFCQIPKTEQIRISYSNQSYNYKIKNTDSTELEVLITGTNYAKFERTFVIKENGLCMIDENAKVLDCFRKLKKATESKLFPSKSK